jgi:hypothetical protein
MRALIVNRPIEADLVFRYMREQLSQHQNLENRLKNQVLMVNMVGMKKDDLFVRFWAKKPSAHGAHGRDLNSKKTSETGKNTESTR